VMVYLFGNISIEGLFLRMMMTVLSVTGFASSSRLKVRDKPITKR